MLSSWILRRTSRTPSRLRGRSPERMVAAPAWGSELGPHLEIAFEPGWSLVPEACKAILPLGRRPWRALRARPRGFLRRARPHRAGLDCALAPRAGPRSNTGTASIWSGVRYLEARRLACGERVSPISCSACLMSLSKWRVDLAGALMPPSPLRLPHGCAPS